jgi:hypothetical protein
MATSLWTTTRNRATDGITNDAGSTAYLWVWTGTAPAKSGNSFVAPTGTNLAKFALANPIGPASSVGVLTLSAISNATGLASGTPGYYRITNTATDTNGSSVVAQGSAGVSSGDLSFASTIASGGIVGITSWTFTEGNP